LNHGKDHWPITRGPEKKSGRGPSARVVDQGNTRIRATDRMRGANRHGNLREKYGDKRWPTNSERMHKQKVIKEAYEIA